MYRAGGWDAVGRTQGGWEPLERRLPHIPGATDVYSFMHLAGQAGDLEHCAATRWLSPVARHANPSEFLTKEPHQ